LLELDVPPPELLDPEPDPEPEDVFEVVKSTSSRILISLDGSSRNGALQLPAALNLRKVG